MPNRPPKDITPARFFEEWLPAELQASGQRPQRDITVRVHLAGEGGGGWDLKMGPAGLAVSAAGQAEPDVTIRQTVADWKAIAVGESGGVDLAPPQSSPTDILFLDRASQQILSTVKGEIRFEVTGFNGRTWSLEVKIGTQPAKGQPDSTISVDAETYAQMLARTLPAPQAFFQGKIRLSGDANLAMQLGMAMMPRFQ